MTLADRTILPMICARTEQSYELVFERLAGSDSYTYVRPQFAGGRQTEAAALVEDFFSDFDEEDNPAPDDEVREEDRAAREPPTVVDAVAISKLDFANCRCPECETVTVRPNRVTGFDFIRCGVCRRYVCPSSVSIQSGREIFTCVCGRSSDLSTSVALDKLDRARTESELDRLNGLRKLIAGPQGYITGPRDG